MKTIFTILLSIAVSVTAFGQKVQLIKHDISNFSNQQLTENVTGGLNPVKKMQNLSLKNSIPDVKQRLDSVVNMKWVDSSSLWVIYSKTDYSYDSSGNNIKYQMSAWDADNNQWTQNSKIDYSYDSKGNLLLYVGQSWDKTTEQYVNTSKYDYSYNADGLLIVNTGYTWDKNAIKWNEQNKNEYSYDANNNRSKYEWSIWDDSTNQWVYLRKFEYVFDNNDRQMQTLGFVWEKGVGEWLPLQKDDYTYNADTTDVISYSWDSTSEQWNNIWYTKYVYNDDENLTHYFMYQWLPETEQWLGKTFYDYVFDTDGNKVEFTMNGWDENTNDWVASRREAYLHNNDYSTSDLIVPYYYTRDVLFFHMLTERTITDWNKDSGEWLNNSKVFYHYSEQDASSVIEISSKKLSVYPNPFTENINFNLADYKGIVNLNIFDVTGKKILSGKIKNNETIRLEGLSRGIYFYNLNVNGKVYSGKIVKQ